MKPGIALVWAFMLYAALSLVSMATMSLGAALLALALLSSGGFRAALHAELRRPASRRYALYSAALGAACVISLVVATLAPVEFGGRHVEVRWPGDLAKLWYFIWPVFIAVGLRRLSSRERDLVLGAWWLTFGALCVLGVFQHFTGWPRPQGIPSDQLPLRYHATLFLGHHLSVASVFIFPFFFALDSWVRARRKVAWAALCLLGGATLFLTYSRTLWVALPIGVLAYGILAFRGERRILLAFILALAVGAGALSRLAPVRERLTRNIGIGERADLWRANFEFAELRPFTGVGWLKTERNSGLYLMQQKGTTEVFSGHAHNNFLEMLGGTGAIGALAWLLWVVFSFRLFWEVRDSGFARGLFCAWIVFQLNGLTQVNFWEGKVMHQMMWMLGWALFWAGEKERA